MEPAGQNEEILEYDVAVLGAGPGGCSAAILLAKAGLKVALLEKSRFPRFRIGESLLPSSKRMLRRLGVWEKMDGAGFLRKYGAEFTIPDASQSVHNRFSDGLLPDCEYAYEVERARFDSLLLAEAQACGCRLFQETTAQSVRDLGAVWELSALEKSRESPLTIRSRWIIDATGRNSFLAKRLKIEKEPLPYPKRLGIYAHFRGIPLQEDERRGNIVITRLPDGWVWNIPLEEDLTSLGVVTTLDRYTDAKVSPEEFFEEEMKRSSYLNNLTRTASRSGQVRVTTDYCLMHRSFAGPRYLLVGDAAAFMDPVFSSGVYFAMESAGNAADLVIDAENRGRALTSREAERYTRTLKKRIRVMRDLIEIFYDNFAFAVFLRPTDRFKLAAAVNAVVAGNTNLPFRAWWRYRLFLLICRLNRRFHFIPLPAFGETAALPSGGVSNS